MWQIAIVLQIDEAILKEVVRMGFDMTQLVESLQRRNQNDVSNFYYTYGLQILFLSIHLV